MNELKGFYSDQFGAIRAVNIDGEPWFNATDITTALGYRNSRDAIAKHVAREDARLFLKSQIATLEDFPNRGLTFINIGDLAKLIKQNGVDIGEKRLFQWMRENGYLIRKDGASYNMPTQKSMDLEVMEIKESTITQPNGSVRISRTPKVTGKGQKYFVNKILAAME